jgi:DNA-binding CsgD family transcriptional regulator
VTAVFNGSRLNSVSTGRRTLAPDIFAALQPGHGGVLIVGEAGMGKSTLAQQVLKGFGPDTHIEYVRGSQASSQIRYAPLGILLSGVDDDGLEHPALVLEGIAATLLDRAKGKRIVLFVDNAENLDTFTSAALVQLARARIVTLFVASQDVDASDGAFMQLWIDGDLRRFDVEPLDPADSEALLEEVLGGKISSVAARSLWQNSGGNPRYLRVLARDQVAAKTLVEHNTIWVLERPLVFTGNIVEVMRPRLLQLPPEHRRLVEQLALAGGISLSALRRLANSLDLEQLEAKGTITVELGSDPLVRVGGQFLRGVITSMLTPGRTRELWDEVARAVHPEDVSERYLPDLGIWALECGASLPTEKVLQAAAAANDKLEPRRALQMIGALKPQHRGAAGLREEVRALLLLGNHLQAEALLADFSPTKDEPIATLVALTGERFAVARATGGTIDDCFHELKNLRGRLVSQLGTSTGSDLGGEADATVRRRNETLEIALGETLLIEAEHAAFEGRYVEVPGLVKLLRDDWDRPPQIRLRAGALLCEAWTVIGRQMEAISLGHMLLAELADPCLPKRLRDVVGTGVFTSLILAGQLDSCLGYCETSRVPAGASLYSDGGDLALGLVHARAGRAEEALAALLPAASQLKVTGNGGGTGLAHAAAAYSYSLLSDENNTRRHLAAAAASAGHQRRLVRRTIEYFSLLASQRLQLSNEAAAVLDRTGTEELAAGNAAVAMIFHSAAAREGGRSFAGNLQKAAAACNGQAAHLCAEFSAGLLSQDPEILLKAAGSAAALGDILFSYDAARAAQAAAVIGGNRAAARKARAIENAGYRRLQGTSTITAVLASLSPFELNLAQLAAQGSSSASLGRRLHLSPRTVDWHLGKMFAKLHISGRADLSELLVAAGLAS